MPTYRSMIMSVHTCKHLSVHTCFCTCDTQKSQHRSHRKSLTNCPHSSINISMHIHAHRSIRMSVHMSRHMKSAVFHLRSAYAQAFRQSAIQSVGRRPVGRPASRFVYAQAHLSRLGDLDAYASIFADLEIGSSSEWGGGVAC